MAIKYKNGTEAKAGDKVVGIDHFGGRCTGEVVAGIPVKGQPSLVFKNSAHGAIQPSLHLIHFLREDEAGPAPEQETATPPLKTAK
jgi:hypothetical protein